MKKVKKAVSVKGPSYLNVLSVCPTGWRCPPDLAVRIGRLAVETGVFPLYEVEDGQYKMSVDFPQLRPLVDYTKLQGRFRHLSEEMLAEIQQRVIEEYHKLKEKAS
jgi:pyruvate ferredoxin oxidoreductase beta subunit